MRPSFGTPENRATFTTPSRIDDAMLSEVRLLRRLQAHDRLRLPDELARAEAVAHVGSMKHVRRLRKCA